MSDERILEVRSSVLAQYGDGQLVTGAASKFGVPFTATKWDQFAIAGYMFNVKQATIGTALTGSAAHNDGIVLTAPSIRFTVPTGKAVFPRRFNLAMIPGATTIDNEIAIIYTAADSWTSGGTAMTPLNWRTDAPRASSVTNCYNASGSAITEAALTSVRSLHQAIFTPAAAFATSYNLNVNYAVEWDDLVPIIGPASFIIYLSAKTAAVTYYFSLDWAEVPSALL